MSVENFSKTNDQGISPLQVTSFSNVLLNPARRTGIVQHPFSIGGFDANNAFVENFRLIRHYGTSIFEPPQAENAILNENFVYGGVIIPHWGHFLLETLARTWYLQQEPSKPILWHNLNFRPNFTPWQAELISMLGLSERHHVFVQEPIRVRSVTVPEPGFVLGTRLHPTQVGALAVHPFRAPIPGRRVWLSRSALPDGAVGGEKELEQQLAANGWDIIHPEKLSVLNQIRAIFDAETVGGFEGSAFHTFILGSNIKTKIRIINRRKDIAQNYNVIANSKWLNQKNFRPEMLITQIAPEKNQFELLNKESIIDFLNAD